MTDLQVFLIVAALVVLALGYAFGKKFLNRRMMTEFTGGEATPSNDTLNPKIWRIGPTVYGENRSAGVPLVPSAHPEGGWCFDIPVGSYPPAGHVHYVTHNHGPLTGKRLVRMKYRIEAAPGVYIGPRTAPPPAPSLLTLYFQREGDDWSNKGKYEAYRWFATFATHAGLTAGENEIIAELDENWTAGAVSSRESNPQAFREAIDNAQALGFVLGGGDGYGHGVYADGPARFVVTEFTVE